MKLEFVAPSHAFPAGHLEINDARIIWPNFAGRPTEFNPDGGKREFNLVIPDEEIFEALKQDKNRYGDSWNVKERPPREDGDSPLRYLPVKVKFNDRGPKAYLKAGTNRPVELDEDSIGCLDNIDIMGVDLDIRPYDWEVNGKTGRTAYLQSIHVTQEVDRFAERYADEFLNDDDCPFD